MNVPARLSAKSCATIIMTGPEFANRYLNNLIVCPPSAGYAVQKT